MNFGFKFSISCLTLSIVALFAPPHLSAKTLYVSTTGSDSNLGTQDQPFATIQTAVNAATPGDTILLADGTYNAPGGCGGTNSAVYISSGGTAGAPITIGPATPYQSGVWTVHLDGGQSCFTWFHFQSGAAYWTIQGLDIYNNTWGGINSNAQSGLITHITIQDNHIHHNGHANETLQEGMTGIGVGNQAYNTYWLIQRNIINNIGRTCTGGTSGCVNNLRYDHGIYAHFNNSTVINNIFYNNLAGADIELASSDTILIANNTHFYPSPDPSPTDDAGRIALTNGDTVTNVSFYNEIFDGVATKNAYPIHQVQPSTVTNCIIDHTLTTAPVVFDGGSTCTVTNSILSTYPLLASSASPPIDFHLQLGSPAIGAGLAVSGVTADFAGTTRPNPPSVGAYEFGSTRGAASETIAPLSVTFIQPVPAGQTGSEIQLVTIANGAAATASLVISSASIAGDFTFGGVGSCGPYPETLTAGQSCTISLKLAPTGSGTRTGTLTISDNAGSNPHTVSLSGTGTTSTASSACDLNSDGIVNSADTQIAVNLALSLQPCGNPSLDGTSVCNVVGVQRVINAALGGTCRTGP